MEQTKQNNAIPSNEYTTFFVGYSGSCTENISITASIRNITVNIPKKIIFDHAVIFLLNFIMEVPPFKLLYFNLHNLSSLVFDYINYF